MSPRSNHRPLRPIPRWDSLAAAAGWVLVSTLVLAGCASTGGEVAPPSATAATSAPSTPSTPTTPSTPLTPTTPTTPADPSSESDLLAVCAQARELIADEPQAAIDLITQVRAPAVELRTADVEIPTGLLPLLDACEDERQDALSAGAAVEPGPTKPVEAFGKNWTGVVDSWIAPLADAGLAVIGIWIGLLIIARLLIFVPWIGNRQWKVSPAQRLIYLFLGLGFIVISPLLLVGRVTGNYSPRTDPLLPAVPELVGWIALCLIGAFLYSRYLANRLRVTLDVVAADGKKDRSRASRLVGYLNQLGVAPPQGLEVPLGSDVTDLKHAALAEATGNKFLAAAQQLLVSLGGSTPWRVVFEESDGIAAVIITRNGRPERSVIINPVDFQLPEVTGGGSHTEKMAAAAILTTLAQHHSELRGLCGATDWRSVGLHYVATTTVKADGDTASTILGKALNFDPMNLLAEVAIHNYRYRLSDDGPTIKAYFDWLVGQISDVIARIDSGARTRLNETEYENLVLRMRLSLVSVARNLIAVDAAYKSQVRQRALEANQALIETLKDEKHFSLPVHDGMRQLSAISLRVFAKRFSFQEDDPTTGAAWTTSDPWCREALRSSAPNIAYSVACAMVVAREEIGLPTVPDRDIKDKLRVGVAASPEKKTWARKDPELKTLSEKWFTDAIGSVTEGAPTTKRSRTRAPLLTLTIGGSHHCCDAPSETAAHPPE
jgi:hypothetical protein